MITIDTRNNYFEFEGNNRYNVEIDYIPGWTRIYLKEEAHYEDGDTKELRLPTREIQSIEFD